MEHISGRACCGHLKSCLLIVVGTRSRNTQVSNLVSGSVNGHLHSGEYLVIGVVSVESDHHDVGSVPSSFSLILIFKVFLDEVASREARGSALDRVHHKHTAGSFTVVKLNIRCEDLEGFLLKTA